jgi:hypothetical protein
MRDLGQVLAFAKSPGHLVPGVTLNANTHDYHGETKQVIGRRSRVRQCGTSRLSWKRYPLFL